MRTKIITALAIAAISSSALVFGYASTTNSVEGAKMPKVQICHKTSSLKKPVKMISVSGNAVPAHLAHGDTLAAPDLNGVMTCVTPTLPPIP